MILKIQMIKSLIPLKRRIQQHLLQVQQIQVTKQVTVHQHNHHLILQVLNPVKSQLDLLLMVLKVILVDLQ